MPNTCVTRVCIDVVYLSADNENRTVFWLNGLVKFHPPSTLLSLRRLLGCSLASIPLRYLSPQARSEAFILQRVYLQYLRSEYYPAYHRREVWWRRLRDCSLHEPDQHIQYQTADMLRELLRSQLAVIAQRAFLNGWWYQMLAWIQWTSKLVSVFRICKKDRRQLLYHSRRRRSVHITPPPLLRWLLVVI